MQQASFKCKTATIGAEELAVISSYQTFSADNKEKSYYPITELIKKLGAPIVVNLSNSLIPLIEMN
jgi:hypothetical protein